MATSAIERAQRVAEAVRFVRAVHDASPEGIEERRRRFNDTTGIFGYISKRGPTGANHHPDRCRCQRHDTTPHKHHGPPHSTLTGCARCLECEAYLPHDAADPTEPDAPQVHAMQLVHSDSEPHEYRCTCGMGGLQRVEARAHLRYYGCPVTLPDDREEEAVPEGYIDWMSAENRRHEADVAARPVTGTKEGR